MAPRSLVGTTRSCCMLQIRMWFVMMGYYHSDGLNPIPDVIIPWMCTCSCVGGLIQRRAATEPVESGPLGPCEPLGLHRLL